MKHDELSFLNLQLAGMLKDGIPLEGAVRQAVSSMRRGSLRRELEKLESDLAAGVPLAEAIAQRKLPPFYVRMIQIGVKSGDFPAVLTLLADYYHRTNLVWTRLKALMIYPLILFAASIALSVWFAVLYSQPASMVIRQSQGWYSSWVFSGPQSVPAQPDSKFIFNLWTPPVVFALIFTALAALTAIPGLRRWWKWRFPAFRDAGLAQLASALHLLLKGGSNLDEALALLEALESRSAAGRDLARWRKRIAGGHSKFQDIIKDSRVIPPLFGWLVSSAGEDLATGFQRASEVYQARAAARTELMLYSALPASIVFIGAMIAVQVYPMMSSIQDAISPLYRVNSVINGTISSVNSPSGKPRPVQPPPAKSAPPTKR